MRRVVFLLVFTWVTCVEAQYWIGPKIGYHYTFHDYQDDTYKDDYKVYNNHNYEIGVVVNYEASERYSVHGELYFERQGTRVVNTPGNFYVDSRSNFHYLSAPILLRVSMGHKPVHWYLNGGPKVSLWLGGRGRLANGIYDEFEENQLDSDGFFNYKIAFNGSKAGGMDNGVFYVNEANRIQYALTVGGGFYLDLANGSRLMVDMRYNWGHSNMGFNIKPEGGSNRAILVGNESNIPAGGYLENYEYSFSSISLSVAYLLEYDTQLRKRGSSTNKESRKNKKTTKKKKG